jgi:hypothetical protein
MKTTQTEAKTISREKFTTFVSGLLEGRPNPEGDPQPPGPWDPYIRQALDRVLEPQPQSRIAGPFPEPWRMRFESSFDPSQPWRTRFETTDERLQSLARVRPEVWDVIGHGGFDRVALNPQPLPPRWAVAVEFVRLASDRIALIQETADVINNTGGERGIIVVGGKISELIEFVCGNSFPRKIPPAPGPGSDPRLAGHELVLMGAEFVRSSKSVANEKLGREFAAAGERLINAGLERL